MTPAEHERIGQLFLAVRELPESDQVAYLDEACGDDPHVRSEVQSLLTADVREAERLAFPTTPLTPPFQFRSTIDPLVGQRIGRFLIQRVIASGGMGTVYEAAQDYPKRLVAVKVIRHGIAGPSTLRRFEYEAQLLARLRHPAIAQIFDAGVHESPIGSMPYFVMEYIHPARTLLDFVTAESLAVDRQFELFISICDGIQHAHQNGVIHRDLKPENILVDGAGQPKIIDFGVAGVLDRGEDSITMHTTMGHLIGTIPYMSPEQAQGDPGKIDIRTDVYSLGVILYQCLSHEFPYEITGNLPDALHNIIHTEPTPPKSGLLNINDEIRTIVLKCLQKVPDRRYQTAEELKRDLQRYLRNEPIEARRDSAWYVLSKTIRRYRLPVAAAVIVFFVTIVSAVALVFMYRSQREQRFRAEREAVVAEQERQVARAAESVAQARQEEAERALYVASLAAASLAITANDSGEALKQLFRAREPWRHWEWNHLFSLTDHSLRTFSYPPAASALGPSRLAFSPDGRFLARSFNNGDVVIWDLDSEACVVRRIAEPCNFVRFASTGNRLIFGTNSAFYALDAQTAQELSRTPSRSGALPALALSPDETLAAFGNDAPYITSIMVMDLRMGTEPLEFKFSRAPDTIGPIEFDSAGRFLAAGSTTGFVALWDLESGQKQFEVVHYPDLIYEVEFSPDDQLLASAGADGSIKLWDVESGREFRTLSGHSQRVQGVAFSRDGTLLASASFDKTVRVWDVRTGACTAMYRGHTAGVWDVAFSPDGSMIASGGIDGTTKFWDVNTAQDVIVMRGLPRRVNSVSFDSESARLVNSVLEGGVTIWNTHNGLKLHELDPELLVRSAIFSHDGSQVICGCLDGSVRFFDLTSGNQSRVLSGAHYGQIHALALSPDGFHLATGAWDHLTVLWDLTTGSGEVLQPGHTDQLTSVEFSPDGTTLATAASDASVKIWDTSSRQLILTYQEHSSTVYDVAYSPDGSQIASASNDQTVKIWDPSTGSTIMTLQGDMLDVWSVAYSPDGKRLATGARDRTVRIWNAETGDELLVLRGPTGTVMTVDWSPDGARIAAGTWAKELFIWDSYPRQQMTALFNKCEGLHGPD